MSDFLREREGGRKSEGIVKMITVVWEKNWNLLLGIFSLCIEFYIGNPTEQR